MLRRLIAIVTCVCMIVMTACTSGIDVPPASYADAELSLDDPYRIETTDGRVYVSDHVTRADSAFVIHSLRVKRPDGYTSGYVPVDSIMVPFSDVAHFGTKHVSAGRTLGLAVVVWGIAIAVFFARGGPGIDWRQGSNKRPGPTS